MKNKNKENISNNNIGVFHKEEENNAVIYSKEEITNRKKLSVVKENYKALRTNIMLSVVKQGCKKIVISSSIPGEGKSTTAANLATSLAQTDKKVLLIDCDLRKPSIYSAMGFSNVPGLTNVLTGLAELGEAINETAFPNLHVLCAGIAVPNPGELLSCEATMNFIKGLEEKYDYILFDTPPINEVSDALPIIKISDGVVLVVRQNYFDRLALTSAVRQFEFIKARVLGIVYNFATESGSAYGKKYHKNYYGYENAYHDAAKAVRKARPQQERQRSADKSSK